MPLFIISNIFTLFTLLYSLIMYYIYVTTYIF